MFVIDRALVKAPTTLPCETSPAAGGRRVVADTAAFAFFALRQALPAAALVDGTSSGLLCGGF
jgi:hypothetical protein